VVIDLTGIREGTGPARLLDMVEGRSKQAFKAWLAGRDEAWRNGVQVVAMEASPGSRPPPPRSCPTRSR
jgi:transposase